MSIAPAFLVVDTLFRLPVKLFRIALMLRSAAPPEEELLAEPMELSVESFGTASGIEL
jgi:hypothetical protein